MHTTSYHTIPYHTIPYHTIPYHTMSCHTTPHNIPYHTHQTILYHILPYYKTVAIVQFKVVHRCVAGICTKYIQRVRTERFLYTDCFLLIHLKHPKRLHCTALMNAFVFNGECSEVTGNQRI